jgi:hypothetical protein
MESVNSRADNNVEVMDLLLTSAVHVVQRFELVKIPVCTMYITPIPVGVDLTAVQ